MILEVLHVTRYNFAHPRRALVQSLRLTPADYECQTVQSWNVDIPGATIGEQFRDGAGDILKTASLAGNVEVVEITVTGQVSTADCLGVLRGRREACPPEAYFRDTALTAPSPEIREFAADALAGVGDDTLTRAHALAAAVTAQVSYVSGSTGAGTSAADALRQGKGVCQDQAHVLIAAALCQDIPARYVIGYLFSGDGHAMGQASHAWTELHVKGLGWVGFDPANQCCPDESYIRLGSGLDAVDAAPIRGLTEGKGDEDLTVSVQVTKAQQQ